MEQQTNTFDLSRCQPDDMPSAASPTYRNWAQARHALNVVAAAPPGPRDRPWQSVSECVRSLEVCSAYMIRQGAAVEAYAALSIACVLHGRVFINNPKATAKLALHGFRFFIHEGQRAHPGTMTGGCVEGAA